MQLSDLIVRASQHLGTEAALATALGVSPQRLNDWKVGRRPCPPKVQAQIAELAGVDAKRWLWDVVMGKAAAIALALGVGAMLSFGSGGSANAAGVRGTSGTAPMYRPRFSAA